MATIVARALALALAPLALAAIAPASAKSQRVTSSVDLQETRLRYADTVDANAMGITPSIRADWDLATLSAFGTYAQLANAWSADGSAAGSLFTPARHGWSGELSGTLGGSTHEDGTRTAAITGTGRLHLDGAHAGAWVGAGAGTTSDGFVWRGVRQGEAGLWLGSGPASVTLAAFPTAVDDSIRYTDLSAQGSWQSGRLELDALLGSRAGAHLPAIASSATTWGSASAALWVLSRAAIVASAGTYPVDYTQGFPGGRFASIGIRIALTRRPPDAAVADVAGAVLPPAGGIQDFRVDPISQGMTVVRVRAPNARTVEMMGDLTAWKTQSLAPAGGGWYTLSIPATPGSSQLVLRIDGGDWSPPPGIPTVRDEFGGTTGVVVIGK